MVRAEGLPLWAFDDPPAAERDAIFAEVQARAPTVSTVGRVVGDIFARIDARAAFPGVLAACRAWGPDVVVSEITEFAGPLAAELVGVPSVCVGISQQGKEEHAHPRHRRRARRAARALRPAARPRRRAPARAGRTSRCCPAALEDPATPARARRAALPRGAPRRAPPPALRRAGRRPAAGLRHLRLGGAARWTSSRACTATPSTRSPALPLRLLVTVGRDRDPAELGPLPANVRVERWVPQADLMPHVAAMVCHGGSGTVTMGLAGGVPMAVAAALRRPAVERRARRRAGRGHRASARGPGGDRRAARGDRPAHRRSGYRAERPAHRRRDARPAAGRRRGRRRPRAARRHARRMTEQWASVTGPCASESTWPTRASPRGAPRRRSSSTGG